MNIINLIVGDHGGDGHCRSHKITISSNLSADEINKAYKIGCKKAKFNLVSDYCHKYDHRTIPKYHIEHLVSKGLKDWNLGDDKDDEDFDLDSDSFTDLYLFIVKLGDPSFIYEAIQGKNINIGGYGLF